MLPDKFLQSLAGIEGFSEEHFVEAHETTKPITSIRFNPSKNAQNSFEELHSNNVIWASNAVYLSSRPSFTLDPLFHAGAYYVQEAGSMFLQQALKQTIDVSKPLKVLDLCAAPGGKSTHLQSLISAESLLISNEVIKTRVNILTENISKWGAANVIVTNNDATHFSKLTGYFDAIVVDAPCSGSGLFRKDKNAINEWSENNVTLCSQRQQRILADVLPALKQEGILIYSTCSYSKQEDEDITTWLINEYNMQSQQLKIDSNWGITETNENGNFAYRFYPDKTKAEGFFIAALKKTKPENEILHSVRIKNTIEYASKKDVVVIKDWIENNNLHFFIQDKNIVAFPENSMNDFNLLKQFLYIKKAGIKLGEIMHNSFIPHHELAMSTMLRSSIPFCNVNKEQALQYLRRQDVQLNAKGWTLIKYENQNLGWIKALPNRINNYYPKDWRILMA